MEESTLILKDDLGRGLECLIENVFALDEVEYYLLQPCDTAVQVFQWQETETEDESELLDVTDEELKTIFPIAQAVLAEQNLELQHTAFTLTVRGDLPEPDADDIIEIDNGDVDSCGEFQELCQFYHQEQAYSVFAAMEPMILIAKRNEEGHPIMLSAEEMDDLQPYLEQLLDVELAEEEV
jgi:hypothetical protein